MQATTLERGDHSEERFAVSQLRREEQSQFLPIGLSLFCLFCLGCAVWNYLTDHVVIGHVLAASGVLSVAMLALLHHCGKNCLTQIRALFGVQILVMTHLFVIFCKTGEAGMLGALCMAPALVSVWGFRWGALLLLLNWLALLGLSMGWLPVQVDRYSDEMWVGFLGAYLGLGFYICGLDFCRDRSRGELVQLTRQFNRIASLDQLTELPNRRAMERLLGGSINRYHLAGEEFSVIVADVDNFKQFNDQFGHQFGDELLKVVGKALHRGLRSDDIVARWGGDEFLVLLRNQKLEGAEQVAERLRKGVAQLKLTVSGEELGVTMSFGVASMAGHQDGDELITSADRGLYQAKHMGRDMVVSG